MTEFTSIKVAAKECGITITTVLRNINRVFTTCVVCDVAGKYLFATNGKSNAMPSIPVNATNVQTGEIHSFSSIEEMKRVLQLPQGGYLKTSYLVPGKVYKKKWLFKYTLYSKPPYGA